MSLLETKNLTFKYSPNTPFEKTALDDVSIKIEKGEFIGVIGHTGSGKSTLVQHLNGLIKPTNGQVLLDGKDIWAEPKKIRDIRFRVGLVFQYPEHQLFEETCYKDIAFGPKNMGLDQQQIKERVFSSAGFVGLKTELLEKSPFDLSGGEKRRVAIAGVMAMNPEILMLDEPTAGLDPYGREIILGQIHQYQKQRDVTVILVSHSMEDIARIADKVLVMNKGKAAMFDTTANVFARGDELEQMGLAVPQITKVFMMLKERGHDVNSGIYNVNSGVSEILSKMNRY